MNTRTLARIERALEKLQATNQALQLLILKAQADIDASIMEEIDRSVYGPRIQKELTK